jgi:hypothetical protein
VGVNNQKRRLSRPSRFGGLKNRRQWNQSDIMITFDHEVETSIRSQNACRFMFRSQHAYTYSAVWSHGPTRSRSQQPSPARGPNISPLTCGGPSLPPQYRRLHSGRQAEHLLILTLVPETLGMFRLSFGFRDHDALADMTKQRFESLYHSFLVSSEYITEPEGGANN